MNTLTQALSYYKGLSDDYSKTIETLRAKLEKAKSLIEIVIKRENHNQGFYRCECALCQFIKEYRGETK